MASSEPEYEIGLALSGGCTAGAYQVGVVDFLFQALREWENERANSPASALPAWRVRLRAMSGASAGGLTTALATAALNLECENVGKEFQPGVSKDPENPLYDGWVAQFDYKSMFKTDDIEPGISETGEAAVVKSFLYSKAMDDYAKRVVNDPARTTSKPIPSWARDIEVYIAATNLRGIQYCVEGISTNAGSSDYKMLEHTDVLGFQAASKTQTAPIRDKLNAIDLNAPRDSDEVWHLLRSASVASSAFPAVFAPVTLTRPLSQVGNPEFSLAPNWPPGISSPFQYDAVDGAVFMVDPIELVARALQRATPQDDNAPLPTEFSKAHASVILIDPFPKNVDLVSNDYKAGTMSVWGALSSLITAMQAEGRFQFDALKAALDVNNASMYMIAPFKQGTPAGQSPLSTAELEGFAGVLHPRIRAHDFLLGRQNCQQFLRSILTIPVAQAVRNPIFGESAHGIADEQGNVPIIPLYGSAREECPAPQWPKFKPEERQALQTDVLGLTQTRIRAVFRAFAYKFGVLRKHNAWNFVWNSTVGKVIDVLCSKMTEYAHQSLTKTLDRF